MKMINDFFKPLKAAAPWKIGLLNFIASLAIFYAPYASSIWMAWLVLLLSYITVIAIYLAFCHLCEKHPEENSTNP